MTIGVIVCVNELRIKSSRGCLLSRILNWFYIDLVNSSAFVARSWCREPSLFFIGCTGVGLLKSRLLILWKEDLSISRGYRELSLKSHLLSLWDESRLRTREVCLLRRVLSTWSLDFCQIGLRWRFPTNSCLTFGRRSSLRLPGLKT